jgi:hypothetical protein
VALVLYSGEKSEPAPDMMSERYMETGALKQPVMKWSLSTGFSCSEFCSQVKGKAGQSFSVAMHSPATGTHKHMPQLSTRDELGIIHMANFAKGDHVAWNSEAGQVSGRIIEIHTHDFDYKGHRHHATEASPQYEIKSDKSDHIAAHKESALKKI